MRKFIIGSALLLLVLAGVMLYMNYDFRAGIAREEPDYVIDARTLFAEYDADEDAANQKYLGKTIEVSGDINHIDKTTDPVTISLEAGAVMGNLVCELSKTVEVDVTGIE
ncbi:MAG: OB-fold putative lipoprotein, partial [Saprospiraceae bacterium]|nr:OB-fold putative lipoprotein [Saprospiraceae bacterium]